MTGGLVNVVSKRPTDTPLREIETQYGSARSVIGTVSYRC